MRVPRIAWSMTLTVTLLAALNYCVSAVLLPYWPGSKIGTMLRYLRSKSLVSSGKPSVVFFGSSRFHSSILPEVFEAHSQENTSIQFINCSQGGMSYWEFSKILDRIDVGRLGLRVCVIEVNPWTFNRHGRHPVTKELIRHKRELGAWGDVNEILAVDGILLKTRLLLQRYLPKHSVTDYMRAYRIAERESESESSLARPGYHTDIAKERKLRTDPDFFAENISECHMLDYTFSTAKANQFRQFLRRLEERGVTTIVVHPPVRKEYFGYVRSHPARRREFEKHLAFLEALGSEHSMVNWQIPDDGGMTNEIFIDYGHCTAEGAHVYSDALARILIGPIEQAVAHASTTDSSSHTSISL